MSALVLFFVLLGISFIAAYVITYYLDNAKTGKAVFYIALFVLCYFYLLANSNPCFDYDTIQAIKTCINKG